MDGQVIEQNGKNWKASFFTIWGGQAFSLLGSQLVQFALVWWLTKTTGSATVLATATLAAMLPEIFLGPLVGTLVDRWNRRLIMIFADTSIALATVALAVLFWSGNVQIWHIYLLLFIRSVGGGFHWPAMQASTSLMVPKEHLARIQGLNQMLRGAMNIGSAPLGALLLEWMPMQGILAIDVVTAMIAVAPLLFVAVPQPVRSVSPEFPNGKTSIWYDLRAGMRYIASWPGLLLITILAALVNFLFVPASSLQPLLVTEHFGGQAMHLAWMEMAAGIGVLAGGLTLSVWGGFKRHIVTTLVWLVVLGLAMAGIGLIPAQGFWAAVPLVFVVGFCLPLVNGPLQAAVQAVVEPEYQGRVFTLIGSIATAMTPLSLIIAGPAADWFGIRSWFVVGGLLAALLGLLAFLSPAIMGFESGRNKPVESRGVGLKGLASQPAEVIGD